MYTKSNKLDFDNNESLRHCT